MGRIDPKTLEEWLSRPEGYEQGESSPYAFSNLPFEERKRAIKKFWPSLVWIQKAHPDIMAKIKDEYGEDFIEGLFAACVDGPKP